MSSLSRLMGKRRLALLLVCIYLVAVFGPTEVTSLRSSPSHSSGKRYGPNRPSTNDFHHRMANEKQIHPDFVDVNDNEYFDGEDRREFSSRRPPPRDTVSKHISTTTGKLLVSLTSGETNSTNYMHSFCVVSKFVLYNSY